MNSYVASTSAVCKAIQRLSARRSHNHLPGYFALLRLRLNSADGTSLQEIEKFHANYLRVPDAPAQKPFLQPFKSRGKGPSLLNRNVQGSYAPSSIRTGKPLSRVIESRYSSATETVKGGVKYALVEDHAAHVLSGMLSGHKILAVSLAFFLSRDRTLTFPDAQPHNMIDALKDFFRLRARDPQGDEIFDMLFEDDAAAYTIQDLEEYGEPK